jgi:hypothetical protein
VGLETPSQAIGRIDPSSLVTPASAVVEPRSTQALVEAFHNGVITADDITSRIGELGRAKEKAQISGAQLQDAQNTAALPNAAPAGALQGQQIEQQQALMKYPATAYFDKFAPALGLEVPKHPDGSVDYVKKEQIGAKLAVWNSDRADAHEKLQNITTKDSADGTVLFAVTKQGESVSPEEVNRLRAKATKTFQMSDLAPGNIVQPVAPVAVVRPSVTTSSPEMDARRAAMANQFGGDAVTGMPDADLIRLEASSKAAAPAATAPAVEVAPRGSGVKPVIAPVGTTIPGVGVSLGSKNDKAHVPPMTGDQQKGLAQAALTEAQLANLSSSFSTLSTTEPWLTGPIMGRLASFTHPENWNKASGDFERAKTAILANLAKGIYHETGVLSDQDIERYGRTIPSAKDTAEVAQSKLVGLQKDIFSSISTNIETMRAQGQEITPLLSSMEQSAKQALQGLQSSPAGGASKPAAGGVLMLPSGRKIQRDANGNYFDVK